MGRGDRRRHPAAPAATKGVGSSSGAGAAVSGEVVAEEEETWEQVSTPSAVLCVAASHSGGGGGGSSQQRKRRSERVPLAVWRGSAAATESQQASTTRGTRGSGGKSVGHSDRHHRGGEAGGSLDHDDNWRQPHHAASTSSSRAAGKGQKRKQQLEDEARQQELASLRARASYDFARRGDHTSDEGDDADAQDDDDDDDEADDGDTWAAASRHGHQTLADIVEAAYVPLEFYVGITDVHLLVEEIQRNTMRFLEIDDCENTMAFQSTELILVASALRNNASISCLALRHLAVADIAVEALCAALRKHPAMGSLDFTGTILTVKGARAILGLLHANPRIVHVGLHGTDLFHTMVDEIELALRYNTLGPPDPIFNPYDNLLVTAADTQRLSEALQGKEMGAVSWDEIQLAPEALGALGRAVCGPFLAGQCRFGSRCALYHPEKFAIAADALEQQSIRERVEAAAAKAAVEAKLLLLHEDQQKEAQNAAAVIAAAAATAAPPPPQQPSVGGRTLSTTLREVLERPELPLAVVAMCCCCVSAAVIKGTL